MSELVKEFWMVNHYDECLHGCNTRWWTSNECKCPIGKPFIEKHSFIKRHLFEAYGIPYNPDGIPREKALEILNEWNGSAARAGVEGYSYHGYNSETKTYTKVTKQYPTRWVHFLDSPKWMRDAKEEHDRKFNIKWEANKKREEEELKIYGLSMRWFYHEVLESFIVPLEICPYAPHYADEIPKDAETEHEWEWGDEFWVCPECKNKFTLINGWKEWKR